MKDANHQESLRLKKQIEETRLKIMELELAELEQKKISEQSTDSRTLLNG